MILLSVVAGAARAQARFWSSVLLEEQLRARVRNVQLAASAGGRTVTEDCPDSMMAARKGGGPSGAEGPKEVTRLSTLKEPADSPKIVTRDGSPPNAAILRWTHARANR